MNLIEIQTQHHAVTFLVVASSKLKLNKNLLLATTENVTAWCWV